MENEALLCILQRIENLLIHKSIVEAKEYIKIEIENLNGETTKKCKNTLYYYNFCNYCKNTNCSNYLKDKNWI